MTVNPTNLRYTKDHEWIKVEGTKGIVGVTNFAQQQLGDIVYVDMPQTGTSLTAGKTFGVVESVKTVSDILAPVSGKVIAKNSDLENDPALVNQDPYGRGWIIEVELSDPEEQKNLMDADSYEKHCNQCEH
ncbi:glycine cleavage system protein GcvH [bacterium]|nr:glycine cleavage system protein GcvH [bacterium]